MSTDEDIKNGQALNWLKIISPGLYAWQLYTFWIGFGVSLAVLIISAAITWTIMLKTSGDADFDMFNRIRRFRTLICIVAFVALAVSGGEFFPP